MLFLEPGGNAYPRGAEAYVILRAVDGEMVKDQTIPGGIVLRPGWSHVTLSAPARCRHPHRRHDLWRNGVDDGPGH